MVEFLKINFSVKKSSLKLKKMIGQNLREISFYRSNIGYVM